MRGRELPDRSLSPIRCLTFLVTLLCGGAFVSSQEVARQPLEFEVDQGRWAVRTGAPMPLRLKVICSSVGILEGDLEIQLSDNFGGVIASIKIPDLIYSPGRQEVEYLLPIQSHTLTPPLRVNCIFRVKQGGVYVSDGLLIPPSRRSFVVPIVRAGEADEKGDDFSWLTLESHCPKHSIDATLSPMLTQTHRISAADLPRDPLKHMAHDIVVMEAGGFTQMVAGQIQALEAWVRGGGSLFLQIGNEERSVEQQAFVDRLVSHNSNLLSDEVEGTQLIPIIAGAQAIPIESGMGHVWLTTERSWAGATEADKRDAFGFLWRLRAEQLDSIRQTGLLTLNLAKQESLQGWNAYQPYQNQAQAYQNQLQMQQAIAAQSGGDDEFLRYWERTLLSPRSNFPNLMIESLMPRDVQAVPIWLLSSIILVYIAAIGFGDYIVLSKLQRRRWTWFTFPAMTLAVSLLSIGTAQGYLSTSQQINVVEFRDVAGDGMLTRIQRFELHFRSSPGQQITPLDQMVFTPVSQQNVTQTARPNGSSMQSGDTQLIAIQGVPTQQAQAFQQIEQWRPQLNRTVSFPRDRQAPLKLNLPQSGVAWSSPKYKADLLSQIQKAFPNAIYLEQFPEQGVAAPDSVLISNQTLDALTCRQLALTCQRPDGMGRQVPLGVFSLFDQISPSADICLADMVIASPGHTVLCVAVREPTGALVIYRWKVRVTD